MLSEKENMPRFTRSLVRAVVISASVLMLGGCGQSKSVEPGDALPGSDIEASALPGLAHVHGLGVNPADDSLMIATHFGLWRMNGSEPKRVGNAAHDFMGFSVVGADRFVASGHPQGARDLPPHLGLIESRDSGSTWRSRSLLGSADFHFLRVTDDMTYGWNSSTGQLMSSPDRRAWKKRGEIALVDLAVDPDDDQQLLGSVAISDDRLELQSSSDAGASWSSVEGAPRLARIAWDQPDLAWGIAPDGQVWRSSDGGESWREAGSVPSDVEAITSSGDQWFAAAGGALLRSTDEGSTWKVLHRYDG